MTTYQLNNGHIVTVSETDVDDLLEIVKDYLSPELSDTLRDIIVQLRSEQVDMTNTAIAGLLCENFQLKQIQIQTKCPSLENKEYMQYLLSSYIPEQDGDISC